MKRIISMLVCCFVFAGVQAQKITREYNNVSLSEALRQLNEQTDEYTISFLYNELEDFRITTSVHRKTVPDAIRQMIGFYPIRMTVEPGIANPSQQEIIVECPQKTALRYKGTVIDEQGQPVAYANIALLSPQDSTLITGGVSNESGFFVIPCEQKPVLARISFVGYKTIYKQCNNAELGTIRMQPETQTLKGVTVKGERPAYKAVSGGMSIAIAGTILSDMGTALDVLGQLPRIDVTGNGNISVYGAGTPVIYINNRKLHDMTELSRLKSNDIKSIDIITSPGAKYDRSISSVIRIRTIKPQGDGFSFSTSTNVRNNKKWGGYEDINVKYRTHGLEIFAEEYVRNSWIGEDNHLGSYLQLPDSYVSIIQTGDTDMRSKVHYEQIGINYDINEHQSLGASYTLNGINIDDAICLNEQSIYKDGVLEGHVTQESCISRNRQPNHEVNLYYLGNFGKLSIDFNGTWYRGKERQSDIREETSLELDDHDVNTHSVQRNKMTAAKLVLTYPIWKGSFSVGSEMTWTRTNSVYTNDNQPLLSSDSKIHESNIAGFAEYALSLGLIKLEAGLRYEQIVSDYYSLGVKEEEPSRTYHDWFPNVSVSWEKDKNNVQLNYSRRINRPSYWALRNFIQYDNRYIYEGGNPLLQPEMNHNIELSAIHSWLNLTARYTYSNNTMAWMPSLYKDKDFALVCNRNYDHGQRLDVSLTASPKFGFYQPVYLVGFQKLYFNSEQYGSELKEYKPSWTFNAKNTFAISETFSAMLNLRYRTDYYNEFQHSKSYFKLDIRLNKTFWNKALTVNLYALDLLRTSKERWDMYGIGVNLTKDCYNYDRTFGMTITYNFNTTRSKYKGTGAGNDEKNRL